MKRLLIFLSFISFGYGSMLAMEEAQETPSLQQLAIKQIVSKRVQVDTLQLPVELFEKIVFEKIKQGQKVDLSALNPELAKKVVAYQIFWKKKKNELLERLFFLLTNPCIPSELPAVANFEEFINAGININEVKSSFYDNETLLFATARDQHRPHVIRYLLQKGSDSNILCSCPDDSDQKISPLAVLHRNLDCYQEDGVEEASDLIANIRACISLLQNAGGRSIKMPDYRRPWVGHLDDLY